MDEEEEHSPSEVRIDLMQKLKQASPKARRPKTILSTNRKVQTKRRLYWYEQSSPLLEATGMKNEKIESGAYLRPSMTTFSRNLFELTKRRRIRAGDSFQFSAQCKFTAILRRNYPRTMSSKNPEKPLQRSECPLFWHEHGKGNKLSSVFSTRWKESRLNGV